MKKLLILALCSLFIAPVFAQDGGGGDASPGFRFGIKLAPNISYFKPADTKVMANDGAKLKFALGLITEFRIAKNYSFVTGIEFPSLTGGNLDFKSDSVNYIPSDDTVPFFVNSRSYNLQYVELPILLKLKTNEIGYMTYFGQLGGLVSIRTKARAEDEGRSFGSLSTSKKEDVDVLKDILFVRASLTIGGGVEYNLSGNTSLVGSLSYVYGLTNVFKSESELLSEGLNGTYKQKATVDQVVLTIGILF